ncbi:leucine--tRNA ligase, cytoplasmic [Plakobranchus ocellatus]|uniref:Leucine--tRNA ligase, cytoplasmic n=1 Tax=Plakobranchus ocellatus TaxID=259542 RepID=A0AAV3YDX9_9GAST|nr:leucine--tRNA ligase, cytoplasmic [Plakobranchus ocellatus]
MFGDSFYAGLFYVYFNKSFLFLPLPLPLPLHLSLLLSLPLPLPLSLPLPLPPPLPLPLPMPLPYLCRGLCLRLYLCLCASNSSPASVSASDSALFLSPRLPLPLSLHQPLLLPPPVSSPLLMSLPPPLPLAPPLPLPLPMPVDWRRCYISTDANPFFDSFVHWTFTRLRERNRIKFGRRYTIFSPKENQPCMDHDRSSGEEAGLQESTLIKLKLKAPYPSKLAAISNRNVYLVAATLRPETMFGQTNCWVRPDMKYVAVEVNGGDVYVSTRRAARNMSYQDMTPNFGSLNVLAELVGQDLVGVGVEAPLCPNQIIHALPLLTIKEDRGTGILTSVPSDILDDFLALRDLKSNKIPIINVQGYGNLYAVHEYENHRDDTEKNGNLLSSPTEERNINGISQGVMLVKGFEGRTVLEVRKSIQAQMLEKGEAILYMEPEKPVMSRSGDECVSALCDQWYLDYGSPDWRAMAKRCLSKMIIFFDEVRKDFETTMDSLDEHACSRTYGLGSRIPWDRQYLIENMSDSNVNMAYYTVCQLLQSPFWDGSQPGSANIRAEQLTPEVWDYIFYKNTQYPAQCTIPQATLNDLRREFEYWYPVDYRMSGKDLVSNNLTYFIYCHTAMWPDDE